jgi:hypothetical protein
MNTAGARFDFKIKARESDMQHVIEVLAPGTSESDISKALKGLVDPELGDVFEGEYLQMSQHQIDR